MLIVCIIIIMYVFYSVTAVSNINTTPHKNVYLRIIIIDKLHIMHDDIYEYLYII